MSKHRKNVHGHIPRGRRQRGGPKCTVDIPEAVLAGLPGCGGEYIPGLPGLPFGAYRRCAPTQQIQTASLVDTPRVAGPSFTENTHAPSPPQSPSSGSMSPYPSHVLSFSAVLGTQYTAAPTPETNRCVLPSPSPSTPPSMCEHQSLYAVSAIRQPTPVGNVVLPTVVYDNGRQATSWPQEDFLCILPPLLPRIERQERAVQLPPFSSLLQYSQASSSTWRDHQAPRMLPPITSMPTPPPPGFGVFVPITRTPTLLSLISPHHTITQLNTASCSFATGSYAPQLPSYSQPTRYHPYHRLGPATYWPTDSRTS